MKAILIGCNDQLAPVWAKMVRPDDPLIDVNRTDRVPFDSFASGWPGFSGSAWNTSRPHCLAAHSPSQ